MKTYNKNERQTHGSDGSYGSDAIVHEDLL